jgi:hypothetical protein
VSVVGFVISGHNARRIHTEKLAFDEQQAERRATAEIALAERKATADMALAARKVVLDQELAVWQRRYDLAEQVLTAAYEARAALDWARGRGMFEGEGRTRKATEPESEKLREARDTAFVPIERLAAQSKVFVTLQTLQDKMAAHFGMDAVTPIHALLEAHRQITTAASVLMQMAATDEDRHAREALRPVRETLYGNRPDAIDKKIETGLEQLEVICKPILAGRAPT